MSYIQQSLGDGETIIARARFHWLYTFKALLFLFVGVSGFLLAIVTAERRPTPFAASDPVTWATAALTLVLLFNSVIFLALMIRRWSTEIGVTSHRFVEKYGLLSMRTNEIALPNIEGVRVHQTILGRLIGYGTVKIEGTGVDSVTTPNIADPVGFVRAIQTAKEFVVRR